MDTHFDQAIDFGTKNMACGTHLTQTNGDGRLRLPGKDSHQNVHGFDDIEKDFIASILHSIGSPTDLIGQGWWWTHLLQSMAFLSDVFLENIRIGRLWKAEVHHFIEQLIDDNEVISNGFFFEFFEIFTKDTNTFVEKWKNHRHIGVDLRCTHH